MLKTNAIFIHQHSPFLKIKTLNISLALHDIEMKRIIGFCSKNTQTLSENLLNYRFNNSVYVKKI